MTRVPFMIIPPTTQFIRLRGIGERLARLFSNLKDELKHAKINTTPANYILAAILSSLTWGIVFFGLLYGLTLVMPEANINIAIYGSIGIFLFFFLILLYYPKIIAEKQAQKMDQHLLFALKDLRLHLAAGTPIFKSFVEIAKADYGVVSEEFQIVAQSIHGGKPIKDSLEEMVERSDSVYLKKTMWQIINTIKAGASLKDALDAVVKQLTDEQYVKINNYASELNLWSLVYMLFAVAIPTIGVTMLIILSSFLNLGISKNMIIGFIVLCLVVQFVLIGFVKSRRPTVQL